MGFNQHIFGLSQRRSYENTILDYDGATMVPVNLLIVLGQAHASEK